jgi:hypothetical protein
MQFLRVTLVILSLVLLAGCAGNARSATSSSQSSQSSSPPSPVQSFEDQGRAHMDDGQTFAYNSNPPTSGPHSAQFVRWGVYNQEIAKEVLVHNMEHGGVIVWYNCRTTRKTLTQAQCDQLYKDLYSTTQPLIDAGKEIVVTNYTNMNHVIALTAWGKLQTLEAFDLVEINKFIRTYERAFNPEGF